MLAKIFLLWIFIIQSICGTVKLQFQKYNEILLNQQNNKLYIPTFFHFIWKNRKKSLSIQSWPVKNPTFLLISLIFNYYMHSHKCIYNIYCWQNYLMTVLKNKELIEYDDIDRKGKRRTVGYVGPYLGKPNVCGQIVVVFNKENQQTSSRSILMHRPEWKSFRTRGLSIPIQRILFPIPE